MNTPSLDFPPPYVDPDLEDENNLSKKPLKQSPPASPPKETSLYPWANLPSSSCTAERHSDSLKAIPSSVTKACRTPVPEPLMQAPTIKYTINPFVLPVNVGPNAATQPWVPTPLMDLSLIHKAANESGPD